MKKETFFDRLRNDILILDGAKGTLLQHHLKSGSCPELANLEQPELVQGIYSAYIEAGADIVSTNTFGATRTKLQSFGLAERTREINVLAARSAKKVSGGRAWVAGNIGPTGSLVDPLGRLTIEETYEVFKEQAAALEEGGADCLLLETFADLMEIKIAIRAARENTNLPILAAMTYESDFLTFTGTDPATAAAVLVASGADAVGVNCSTGPEPMLEVLGRYAVTTDRPLFVEPNAGMPRLQSGTDRYDVSPEEMARFAVRFVEIGAGIIGTCCGSTPEHTRALKKALKGSKPLSRTVEPALLLSSRTRTVFIGKNKPFCIIGERINPTNRKELADALRDDNLGLIHEEAASQVREGAHVLDVNAGLPEIDEAAVLSGMVKTLSNSVRAPLCVDCTRPEALEAALIRIPGKALINSVNGGTASLKSVLPLAKKYGAAVLCLAVGERGIPKSAEERIRVLKAIVSEAERLGIPKSDLICDCLTLTVSAEQQRAEETLKAVRMVKEELNLPAVLGISNISFGLPDRSLVNASFLSMAMAEGLDAAIMNPGDARMIETVRSASVLTLRDRDSLEFVKSHVRKRKNAAGTDARSVSAKESEIQKKVEDAVLSGNRDGIDVLIRRALEEGHSAVEINESWLVPAIQRVGLQYELREIFLPQMILSAETLQKAFRILEPHFGSASKRHKGVVILCTVKGDVHDIGKNIVGLFLQNHGFKVVDLGKDVAAETIVENAARHGADVVGLSALMTTTMTEMPSVIQALKKAGSRAKVVIGGAVVTKRYADEIGADGYAKDGGAAPEVIKKLIPHP
jgi:5-methyltetrahydrofolate--homocysteine methyltransferase